MAVLNEIIRNSAIGMLSKKQQSLILLLISAIFCVLLIMIGAIITNGSNMQFDFSY